MLNRIIAAVLAAASCVIITGGKVKADVKSGEKPMFKTADIRIRDPFILPVPEEKKYYLYGTRRAMPDASGPASFETFSSTDLKVWDGPTTVFDGGDGFWGTRDYWAPEVHCYKGKYYMFATFSTDKVLRATQILVSDSPKGPFKPLTDRPITPFGWQCLDGTLFVDESKTPWIVFCHEWEQVNDGEICAMPMTSDLKYSAGKSVLLFHGSDAPWVAKTPWNPGTEEVKNYITDGPFLYRTKSGQLLMLWSSFGKNGYVQALARSESGKITGPWKQDPALVYDGDGGHGMIFKTFDGKLMLTLHSPNSGGEHPVFIPILEKDDKIIIASPE